MQKLGILFIAALFAVACNSETKENAEDQKPEISMENLVEVTIPVHGMTCEGCENAVKKSVESLAGIGEVTASHMDSTAVVKYDKTQVSQADIEGKVKEAGYTVVN